MIIRIPKRKKRKISINKPPKPLSYAEQQARRLEGRDKPTEIEYKHNSIEVPLYCEKTMRSFKFNTYDVDSFYGIKGIYFLFNDKMQVVYIGESADCVARIKDHFDNPDKKFKYFKIFRFDTSDLGRKDIEKKLIQKFNPIFNKTHNKYNFV